MGAKIFHHAHGALSGVRSPGSSVGNASFAPPAEADPIERAKNATFHPMQETGNILSISHGGAAHEPASDTIRIPELLYLFYLRDLTDNRLLTQYVLIQRHCVSNLPGVCGRRRTEKQGIRCRAEARFETQSILRKSGSVGEPPQDCGRRIVRSNHLDPRVFQKTRQVDVFRNPASTQDADANWNGGAIFETALRFFNMAAPHWPTSICPFVRLSICPFIRLSVYRSAQSYALVSSFLFLCLLFLSLVFKSLSATPHLAIHL